MSARITEENVLSLVGLIYDAVLDPQRWQDFLTAFARTVEAQGTLIFSHNVQTFEADVGGDTSAPNAVVNFDPAFVQSLGQHYNQVNVWAHNEEVLKPGRTVTGSMLYPVRELPKTEFYNDWLRPQQLFHAVGGLIIQDGPWATKFSALRSKRAGDYTSDELRLYDALLPHLAQAARLQRRYAFLQSLSSSSLEVLDAVPACVMLLDAFGRVLHVNASATAELRRADPLEQHSSGELRTRGGSQAQSALRAVIGAAVSPIKGSKEKLPTVAQLSRRNGEILTVQSLPISQSNRRKVITTVHQRLASCALIIHGASPSPDLGPQVLRHVFRLTSAEIQLVLALADGETIKQYAERRGVSRYTAANQLQRAFDKTGMRRQSELVRWVLQNGGGSRTAGSRQRVRQVG